jgi:hypothetical protein
MDQLTNPAANLAVRHDGWTDARKAQFLEHLAGHGNVRAACARVAMSHEAAYRLRRRDALFARAWAAALNLAREASAQVLACRAIDGIEEEIWYRGEVVGTRRRYDSRLLLAHMARLDAAAQAEGAREDAARFDELVALIAGAEPSEALVCDDDGVPISREANVSVAMETAVELAREEAELNGTGEAELSPAEHYAAGHEAAAQWDAWVGLAHAAVDRLLAEPLGSAAPPAAEAP